MNKKQLSEHIGNIDDRLIEQAGKIQYYAQRYHKERTRRFTVAAAVFILMAFSFSAGALVFARETVIKVPVKQETVTLGEIGLTLVLPDTWKGKYAIEKKENNYIFYNKKTRESANGYEGILFYIVCYDGAMTPEQLIEKGYVAVPYQYLFSTSNKTYVLCNITDVQWDPDNQEQAALHEQMGIEIGKIKFIVDNAFTD